MGARDGEVESGSEGWGSGEHERGIGEWRAGARDRGVESGSEGWGSGEWE